MLLLRFEFTCIQQGQYYHSFSINLLDTAILIFSPHSSPGEASFDDNVINAFDASFGLAKKARMNKNVNGII